MIGIAYAAEQPPATGPTNAQPPDSVEGLISGIEREIASDTAALAILPQTMAEQWRYFVDGAAEAGGLPANLAFILLAALLAFAAEKAVAIGTARRLQHNLRDPAHQPTLRGLVLRLAIDACGVAAFALVFTLVVRHWSGGSSWRVATASFVLEILIRWRLAVLFAEIVLRPSLPAARLAPLDDPTARRFAGRFSAFALTICTLTASGRAIQGLSLPEGVIHLAGLAVAVLVYCLLAIIIIGGRRAPEAMIRGRESVGTVAAVRAALARGWVGVGMTMLTIYMFAFVFALSLDLLGYFWALKSSLGILLLLALSESLSARAWRVRTPEAEARFQMERALARALRFCTRAALFLTAFVTIAWTWIAALQLSDEEAIHARRTSLVVAVTLMFASAIWGFAKLAIDRHLQPARSSAAARGGDAEEEEVSPASRLQTMLPFLRAALAIVIAVFATLIVLSRMGVDTAPLIAGAGVFGLAISFGSQSLVRDIISGLFFIAEDAFRVGEYIDTGKLKGTVEGMSIRSLKLRHQNGALHTIPFGQLGAVSNFSRDWSITKFNIRLAIGCDIEKVRKLIKKIGQDMSAIPEMAVEVIDPLKLQGIAEFADGALVVRLKFTSRPAKSSWVMRQYLKRIYEVLPAAGITFASGAMTLIQGPVPSDMARSSASVMPLPPRETAPRG